MAISALRWFKAALVLQILLLAYWLAVEVVDLFPWNDLASRPSGYDLRGSIAFNALPLLACMLLFASGLRPLAMLGVAGYAAYLVWQLWTWWKPYALGADAAWQAFHNESLSRTLKALPTFGVHYPPDAQHVALQLLTLATLITTIVAVDRMRHL